MIKVRMNQLCVVFKLILTLTSPSSALMTTFPIMLSGQTRGNSLTTHLCQNLLVWLFPWSGRCHGDATCLWSSV